MAAGKSADRRGGPGIRVGYPSMARCGPIGSTTAPNLQARFAVDDDMRTWWQPAQGDTNPVLTSTFMAPATVHAVRLIWRDVGLDTGRGVKPGAFRYRVELETAKDHWTTILDRSQSEDDLLNDYRQCPPANGGRARLVILGWPEGPQTGRRGIHSVWKDPGPLKHE